METLWQKIPEWEEYQISTQSEIRKNGKVIRQYTRKVGIPYKTVKLRKKTYLVHKLVAVTYIPNPDNLPCVGHKDENPQNNCVDNLYWTSYKDNNNYGTHTLKQSISASMPVTQYNLQGEEVNYYRGVNEATRQTGINKAHISQCCNGKRLTAGGYTWEYSQTLF